mmetsp:Transcript_25384/g.64475  ORF Transcript_25384/g.64475 Transcript_25384/m.64475 type:complete len:236 (-) Transcript_25384:1168-1875(-)
MHLARGKAHKVVLHPVPQRVAARRLVDERVQQVRHEHGQAHGVDQRQRHDAVAGRLHQARRHKGAVAVRDHAHLVHPQGIQHGQHPLRRPLRSGHLLARAQAHGHVRELGHDDRLPAGARLRGDVRQDVQVRQQAHAHAVQEQNRGRRRVAGVGWPGSCTARGGTAGTADAWDGAHMARVRLLLGEEGGGGAGRAGCCGLSPCCYPGQPLPSAQPLQQRAGPLLAHDSGWGGGCV